MARRIRALSLHGLLRSGAGSMRVAGSVGADADTYPLEWNEHSAGAEPERLDNACRDLSATSEQIRILTDVLSICGLHTGVLLRRNSVHAGDKGQDAGRDRGLLRAWLQETAECRVKFAIL